MPHVFSVPEMGPDPEPRMTELGAVAILRSCADAVIAETVQGVVTGWNEGATVLYGYTAEQMLGQSIERLFPVGGEVQERLRRARVSAGLAESGTRCRLRRVDGRLVDVILSRWPVRDAQGRLVGVASISRQVNDREETDSQVASLLEGAPDGLLCVDTAGRITMANAQAGDLFGYARDELLGQPVELLLPEALRDGHTEHRAEFARHPRIRPMGVGLSLSGRRRDGSTFPVEISLAAEGVGDRMVVIAAVRDVTRQRDIEQAVRVSETQLRQLAENVDTVFILRQLNPLALLYVSPGIGRFTGHDAADLIDSPDLLINVVHPEDRGTFAEYMAASRDGAAASAEFRFIRPDGRIRWVRASASPVPNPGGVPARTVTAMEDVTDRALAEADLRAARVEAERANAAKSELLSRMSHELRTPLNAVLGFGQLLELDELTGDQHDAVHHILRGGRHLLALVDDLLDISKQDSDRLDMTVEPVPVSEVLTETLASVAPLAASAGITIHHQPGRDAGDVYVQADRRRLCQVVLNLLSNAVKYNEAGGRVDVRCEMAGGALDIVVADTGPGISATELPRLFTPFDRLGAHTTGIGGSGIGLALSQRLMSGMGGRLRVSSQAGVGSTFTASIPLASPTPRASSTKSTPAGGPTVVGEPGPPTPGSATGRTVPTPT